MTAKTKPRKTRRKTTASTPMPRKVAPTDLAKSREFVERREELEEEQTEAAVVLAGIEARLATLEVERKRWRRLAIDRRYRMIPADRIEPDGSIHRGGTDQ